MSAALKLDVSALAAACEEVRKASGRSCAESLRRAALHTMIGSKASPGMVHLTEKASRAKIDALPEKAIRAFVVEKLRKEGRLADVTADEIVKLTKKERRRRRAASGYTAYLGWHNAIIAMGGKGIGTKAGTGRGPGRKFKDYSAGEGYGKNPKVGMLMEAVISNTTPMGEELGGKVIQRALDGAAQDLMDYATRKIAEAAKKSGF